MHLTIPLDVQEQRVSESDFRYYPAASHNLEGQTQSSEEQVARALDILHAAQRPLIIAAASAGYGSDGTWLQKFIETTRIPLMTADQARGLVSDDHPYCLGFFDTALNWAAKLVGRADTVLVLGKKLDNSIRYGGIFDDAARIVQVDPSPMEIGRNRAVDVGMAGDISAIVQQMTSAAQGKAWSERQSWIEEMREQKRAQLEWYDGIAKPETPMHASYVHKVLSEFLKPGGYSRLGRWRLRALWSYAASGADAPSLVLLLPVRNPGQRSADGHCGAGRASGPAGGADGGRRGFRLHRHGVRHGGASQPANCRGAGQRRYVGIDYHIQVGLFGRDTATKLLYTRYDKVVEGLGGYGQHVTRPEELAPALRRAFDSGRPNLVNVEIQCGISPRAEAAIDKWLERRGTMKS